MRLFPSSYTTPASLDLQAGTLAGLSSTWGPQEADERGSCLEDVGGQVWVGQSVLCGVEAVAAPGFGVAAGLGRRMEASDSKPTLYEEPAAAAVVADACQDQTGAMLGLRRLGVASVCVLVCGSASGL